MVGANERAIRHLLRRRSPDHHGLPGQRALDAHQNQIHAQPDRVIGFVIDLPVGEQQVEADRFSEIEAQTGFLWGHAGMFTRSRLTGDTERRIRRPFFGLVG